MLQPLITRGRRYAEAAFAESRHVEVTALVETEADLVTLTVQAANCNGDEDNRTVFRRAVEQVVWQSDVRSVIVIAEVWIRVTRRYPTASRTPRPESEQRREGLVVVVETPTEFSISISEITRWDGEACLGPWREPPALSIPDLTGFLPRVTDGLVN